MIKELKATRKKIRVIKAEVKWVFCADLAADGSAGLSESLIFHSTRTVISAYFSSSLDSLLWNGSQESTGGSNKMNYFKLPIVTVPHGWIEPIYVRNAVTENPQYYHLKRAKKGPWDILLIIVQTANRHWIPRTEVIKCKVEEGRKIFFTMDLQSYHLIIQNPS